MSELDDLRRIAYGRTTSAAEEAAAADARAALARHDAAVSADRAALEADAFARTRAAERAPVSDGEPGADEHATLTIVEVGDEPGLLRRFAASWRVWAVPAFTAFVAGIVLTVTSGVFVLNAAGSAVSTGTRSGHGDGDRDGSEILDEGAVVGQAPDTEPGNLERATALLASPQSGEDVLPAPNDAVDPTTTHRLKSTTDNIAFAAMSDGGDNICFVVVDPAGTTFSTCAPPSSFARSGIWIGTEAAGVKLTFRWNGERVTESRTTS
jgi:hypothetical protein